MLEFLKVCSLEGYEPIDELFVVDLQKALTEKLAEPIT